MESFPSVSQFISVLHGHFVCLKSEVQTRLRSQSAAIKQHRCKTLMEHHYVSTDRIWRRRHGSSHVEQSSPFHLPAAGNSNWRQLGSPDDARQRRRSETGENRSRSQSKAAAPVGGRPLLSPCCCGHIPMETGVVVFLKFGRTEGKNLLRGNENTPRPLGREGVGGHTSSGLCVCMCFVRACPSESPLGVSFFKFRAEKREWSEKV